MAGRLQRSSPPILERAKAPSCVFRHFRPRRPGRAGPHNSVPYFIPGPHETYQSLWCSSWRLDVGNRSRRLSRTSDGRLSGGTENGTRPRHYG
eukprot:9848447-Alexandrium_andersonii.AAC.1